MARSASAATTALTKPGAMERSKHQLNQIASNIGGTADSLRRQLAAVEAGARWRRRAAACTSGHSPSLRSCHRAATQSAAATLRTPAADSAPVAAAGCPRPPVDLKADAVGLKEFQDYQTKLNLQRADLEERIAKNKAWIVSDEHQPRPPGRMLYRTAARWMAAGQARCGRWAYRSSAPPPCFGLCAAVDGACMWACACPNAHALRPACPLTGKL
jgi:hypothetical protein